MELSDYIGYLAIPFEQVEYEVPTILPKALQDYIVKCSPLDKPEARQVTFLRK
jgi:hypothetical protein